MAARACLGVLLLCVLVGGATSCHEEEKAAGVYYTGWVPPGQVPPALEQIGDRAVNIIDLAGAGDWPQVYAYVGDITDRWFDYKHPTVVPPSYPRRGGTLLYGDLDAALARLHEAARARDPFKTMWAANDVDAAAIDLMEYYHPRVPGALRRLAVLQRRILLEAWEGRTDTATDTLIAVRETWRHVRPLVVARSSEQVARAFDDNLAAQQEALDAGEVIVLGDRAETALIALREMTQLSY